MNPGPDPAVPRLEAWLFLGPTGAGKTPLGIALERAGWNGRRCLHFDLGAELRAADAGGGVSPGLTDGEKDIVRRVLRDGALFEDKDAPLVRKIFDGFLRRSVARASDLILLNGWPRHLGQAKDAEKAAAVSRVLLLDVPAGITAGRIRSDFGGDRAVRKDDSPENIEAKLALYEGRTKPLAGHYAARGVPVTTLEVGPETSADDLIGQLRRRLGGSRSDLGETP